MCFCFKEISSRSVSLPLSLYALYFGTESESVLRSSVTASMNLWIQFVADLTPGLPQTTAVRMFTSWPIVCSPEDY